MLTSRSYGGNVAGKLVAADCIMHKGLPKRDTWDHTGWYVRRGTALRITNVLYAKYTLHKCTLYKYNESLRMRVAMIRAVVASASFFHFENCHASSNYRRNPAALQSRFSSIFVRCKKILMSQQYGSVICIL